MIYTIHKGKHRPRWWWLHLALWFNKTIIRRQVTFLFDSKYDLQGDDQEDHNKLFGIGYLPGTHEQSARFGWRYDPEKLCFILSAYCYVKGQRIRKDLCEAMPNKRYLLMLSIAPTYYEFSVAERESNQQLGNYSIPRWHNNKIGYRLGLFFGGNRTAPKNITLDLKKV